MTQRHAQIQYAEVEGSHVAYEVFGDGPVDLMLHIGWSSHVDAHWDVPQVADFLERLASFARVICLDRRGHGLSDPIDVDNVTLEEWMEDLTAVADAVGSERTFIVGTGEAGPMSMLYASTYPDRVAGLVLVNTWAKATRTDDYPIGLPPATAEAYVDGIRFAMLTDDITVAFKGFTSSPMLMDPANREEAERHRRMWRHASSPGIAVRMARLTMQTDVRHIVGSVRVPTLILHREGDRWIRVAHGRYLAERIPHAKYVELPGEEHFAWLGGFDSLTDEIEEFVTGERPVREPDRVLATVLFTDIVESTERLAAAGDHRWRGMLAEHQRIVRRELDRHRGQEVHTSGDGFLATFDGPARAVRCACAIVDGVREIGLDVRAGLHTGEIELAGDEVAGIAVHIGSRVSDLASRGEVLVSRTVVDLVAGSGLAFLDRGVHALKGVPGQWPLYAVAR